jgi:hypothetical protein
MASSETLRQRRGGASSRGGTTWEEYQDESSGVGDDGEEEDDEGDDYEGEDEEGYVPIGPLSLYFPDALVRALIAQKPSMEISFIEAEQALLHADGDVDDAMLHVRKQRESRAQRRKEGSQGEFGHRELFERAAAMTEAGDSSTTNTGQRMMRWITTIASSAVLVLVVISLLIVAMVDGVIEVPQMVKDVARDIADSRRRGP